jgi:hypothetical protein
MPIRQETNDAKRFGAKADQGLHVERFEARIDADPVARLEPTREVHGLSVDENQLHFRVGDAERLDHMLDRGVGSTVDDEVPLTPPSRQELVELLVETESWHVGEDFS